MPSGSWWMEPGIRAPVNVGSLPKAPQSETAQLQSLLFPVVLLLEENGMSHDMKQQVHEA